MTWDFWQQLEFGDFGDPHWLLFMQAWGWTFVIAIVSWIIALIIGTVVGTIRTLPSDRLSNRIFITLGNAWVDIFRNVPVLVQIFTWQYVVPALITPLQFLRNYPIIMAICALSIFTSTRIAEQIKAGVFSLPSGQRNAALALGLNTKQSYLYVLLPITLRIIMPPLTSEAMNIVKNTTVAVALVGTYELMRFAYDIGGYNENAILQIYLAVTIAYMITSTLFNIVMRIIDKRLRIPGLASNRAGGK